MGNRLKTEEKLTRCRVAEGRGFGKGISIAWNGGGNGGGVGILLSASSPEVLFREGFTAITAMS